jgi:catechol 2,3-dioxygenase-like lactoylglutathione lyase family enzyme
MSEIRARLVVINHIALEVGDLAEALVFYARVFAFELLGAQRMAFIGMGDQFLSLSEGRRQAADDSRQFGLIVDDRSTVRPAAEAAGATIPPGDGLDFLDLWGNHIQVVEYRDVQFSKTDGVLRHLEVDPAKTDEALLEIRKKGMGS